VPQPQDHHTGLEDHRNGHKTILHPAVNVRLNNTVTNHHEESRMCTVEPV